MTDIQISEWYRGIGIHTGQNAQRIESVVKPEIDRVFATEDPERLAAIARDALWAPEARLLAAALVEATFEAAAEDRAVRPRVDLQVVRASVSGLNSVEWRDPFLFCSLLDAQPLGDQEAPRRPFQLPEGV